MDSMDLRTQESRVPGNKKGTLWAPILEIHGQELYLKRAWSAGQNRLLEIDLNWAVVAQAFNPSTLKAEAGGSVSLVYRVSSRTAGTGTTDTA